MTCPVRTAGIIVNVVGTVVVLLALVFMVRTRGVTERLRNSAREMLRESRQNLDECRRLTGHDGTAQDPWTTG